MAKYPIFLELSNRRVVLIGAGSVAARKAQSLLEAGARLVVIAENADNLLQITQGKNAELIKAKYSKQYLTGAVLVIAATNNQTLNKQIYADCQQLEILCNIVDVPDLCDFFVPSVVKRNSLQVAVSTDGSCPAYAGHIRKKLQQIFTPEHGEFLDQLKSIRQGIIENVTNPEDRKMILGHLVEDESFQFFKEKGPDAWRNRALNIIKNPRQNTQ